MSGPAVCAPLFTDVGLFVAQGGCGAEGKCMCSLLFPPWRRDHLRQCSTPQGFRFRCWYLSARLVNGELLC